MNGPVLGRLADIADGGSVELTPAGSPRSLMAIRRGDAVFVYVNDCPHRNLPLDIEPGRFLDRDGRHILCTNHGALFRIDDGVCVAGPCRGQRLAAIRVTVRHDGTIVGG
jgi:nitrite reductase/ring-hydroxylating ferredoxin subunit